MNLTTGKSSTKHILDLDTLSQININQKLRDGGWRIEAIIVTNNESKNASKHAFFIPAQSRPQPIGSRSATVQPQSNRGQPQQSIQSVIAPSSSLVNRLEQEASTNQYLYQKNAIENDLQQSHFRSRSVQYQASTDEDGRLRTVHLSICPCGQRTEILAQTVHLMD